jgi:UDP-3-O-[3-hydroxymyristoyl] glucosamine N-acyltransferase
MGDAGFTLGQLAAALKATVEGDATRVVSGVAALESAGPEHIAFVSDGRYRATAMTSRAGAFLAGDDIDGLPAPVVRCREPRLRLIELINLFHPAAAPLPGVDPSARVVAGARVHPSAAIGPLAVVEAGAIIGARVHLHALVYVGPGAEIGDDSVLYPHVVVRDGVRLGRRGVVHPGTVLGADGFGYTWDGVAHRKIPQVGTVIIEDDVEIGANTTIDRGTLGPTIVRRGVKLDNLVMVAHNVEIGEDTVIAAQTGISGSCRVGRGVILGGQVGIGDHVTIGDGAILSSQTGVTSDVPARARLAGTYGRPLMEFQRIWIAERQVPDLLRRVRELERRVEELTKGE